MPKQTSFWIVSSIGAAISFWALTAEGDPIFKLGYTCILFALTAAICLISIRMLLTTFDLAGPSAPLVRRIGAIQIGILMGVGTGLIVAYFARPFLGFANLHKVLSDDYSVRLINMFIAIGILSLFMSGLRIAVAFLRTPSMRKAFIFLVAAPTVFILAALIATGAQWVPPGWYERSEMSFYRLLLDIRGEHLPNHTSIMILEIEPVNGRSPSKVISLIDSLGPKEFVIHSGSYGRKDLVGVQPAKVYWDFAYSNGALPTDVDGASSQCSFAPLFWKAQPADNGLSLEEKVINYFNGRKQGEIAAVRQSSSTLGKREFFNRRESAYGLIDYYFDHYTEKSIFDHLYIRYVPDDSTWSIFSYSMKERRGLEYRFDERSGQILKLNPGNVPVPASASDLAFIREKIVVLESPYDPWLYGASPSWDPARANSSFPSLLQNMIDEDYISEPEDVSYRYMVGGFIVVLFSLFYFLPVWRATNLSLRAAIVGFSVLILIFLRFQMFISPMPFLVSLVLCCAMAVPYGAIAEASAMRAERMHLLLELRTARDMQMGLMPTSNPLVNGFDISGICNPAEEVGGDYFDYLWLDDAKTRLGIAIADVSGKGMKAAMTAVMTSGMVYREIGGNESPRSILQKINKPMYLKTDRQIFTAMSFAVIDTKTRIMTLSNAGQMQPLVKRRADGAVYYLKVEGARLPLGIQERIEYGEIEVRLAAGDLVIFYTDGIPEAMNQRRDLYGFERLESIVGNLSNELTGKEIISRVLADVSAFVSQAQQHDDITIVVVKVL